MYLGGNRRWVPLTAGLYVVTEQKAEFFFTLYCFVVKATSVQQI